MDDRRDSRTVERRLAEWTVRQLEERLEAMLPDEARPLVRQLALAQERLTSHIRDDEEDRAMPLMAGRLRLPPEDLHAAHQAALHEL